MEQQQSDLESQVKRIADSLERFEELYLRQLSAYDEDRKKYDENSVRSEKKYDESLARSERNMIAKAVINLFVLAAAITALVIAIVK